jgi:hypothetical protein
MTSKIGLAVFLSALILSAVPFEVFSNGDPEVRVITAEEATTTSKCIGDPKTPLCAVETFIACFARHDGDLCQRVGIPGGDFDARTDASAEVVKYVPLDVRPVNPKDFPAEVQGAAWVQPGNVEVVILNKTWVSPVLCPEPCEGERFYYFVRPVGAEWHVVSWSSENEPI